MVQLPAWQCKQQNMQHVAFLGRRLLVERALGRSLMPSLQHKHTCIAGSGWALIWTRSVIGADIARLTA
jgi:hypothetical protein